MLFGCAALLSIASCILAAVSWRWDRRARWLVYLNGGYLATTAARKKGSRAKRGQNYLCPGSLSLARPKRSQPK